MLLLKWQVRKLSRKPYIKLNGMAYFSFSNKVL
jgi:hypothetical protein